jgi:hypothetical protein
MRSRLTSQNLNDERRRLCAGSTSGVSLSAISRGGALEDLFDFRNLRLGLDVLTRLRLSRPALINDSPFS